MNSSRADSRVNCLKTSDFSETHSVSILSESDLATLTRTVAYICCGRGPARRSGPIGVSRRRHYVIAPGLEYGVCFRALRWVKTEEWLLRQRDVNLRFAKVSALN
jgi:hypothetical protein